MRAVVAGLALAAIGLLLILTAPNPAGTNAPLAEIPAAATTFADDPGSRTEASLPDGTQFIVMARPAIADDWLGTTASIVIDLDGESRSAGTLRFERDLTTTGYEYADGVYRIPAGGILVVLELDPAVLRRLGPGVGETLQRSIRGNSESGFPVIRLRAPFEWASDEESQEPMAVRFSAFEVRRGCSELAVACSPEESIQVIWRTSEFASASALEQPEVRVFRLVP